MEVDEGNESERSVTPYSAIEDDFATTIALLEMEVDEIQVEVQHSLEDVSNKSICFFWTFYHRISVTNTLF